MKGQNRKKLKGRMFALRQIILMFLAAFLSHSSDISSVIK
jgi:hypothetical protein